MNTEKLQWKMLHINYESLLFVIPRYAFMLLVYVEKLTINDFLLNIFSDLCTKKY